MRIGIICYPTFGGSGVVATELGRWLALRGHQVHLMSYARPFLLTSMSDSKMQFHKVDLLDYPVFPSPSYTLSLAVKIAEVTREMDLEVVHVHYAVPHAVSAYLARQMLEPRRVGVVTTLHGTDITLVGRNPALRQVVQFAIEQSDAVTAVSNWLRDQTISQLDIRRPVEVVPNSVDPTIFRRRQHPCSRCRFLGEGEKAIVHISNFRPVKRTPDIVRAFAQIREKVPARLLLVGDGPERQLAEDTARDLGVLDHTSFMGPHTWTECFYAMADLFLFASEKESFGLAALEAMSAEVPVVGYAGGGLPEVVRDGETGYLVPVGDVAALAERAVEVLCDPERSRQMGARARQIVLEQYHPDKIVARYERIYQRVLDAILSGSPTQ